MSLLAAACGGDDGRPDGMDAGPSDAGLPPRATVGPADRRAQVVLPFEIDEPIPLVVLLHGYTASSLVQDAYFRTTPRARSTGFALLLPDGTFDESGNRHWAALPGFLGRPGTVDDVGYINGLVDEVIGRFPIDPDRVYLLGHSNGGFMAYRLACDTADRYAALASLAGSSYPDEADCSPSRPVSVLQIHGDLDDIIEYAGTTAFPGAVEIAERWARFDGCDPVSSAGEPFDYEASVAGAETQVQRWAGCDATTEVELWTIAGGGHLPAVTDTGVDAMLGWLLRQ